METDPTRLQRCNSLHVQSNLWGMETQQWLLCLSTDPRSIESMRNGNCRSRLSLETHDSSSIESMRNGNHDKLGGHRKFHTGSIESMRNGNTERTPRWATARGGSIESMRNGNKIARITIFPAPHVQSNLWGMETLRYLPLRTLRKAFNRIYEEWKQRSSTSTKWLCFLVQSNLWGMETRLQCRGAELQTEVQSNLWGMETVQWWFW